MRRLLDCRGTIVRDRQPRHNLFGQTPKPVILQEDGFYDPRPLGPDGRRIGALPGKDANGAFPKTYYVGDIVTAKPADQPAVRRGPRLGHSTFMI